MPLVAACVVTWGAAEVHARSAGITATSCTSCHGTTAGAELEVRLEPEVAMPGDEITIRVRVGGSNVRAAGIAIDGPDGGEFVVPAGEPLSVSGSWVTHTQPKPAVDGVVEFVVGWVSPGEAGSGAYTVAVVATNADNRQVGDRVAEVYGRLTYGCAATTLYRDDDGDGVGVTSQFLTDCEGLAGFAVLEGDCDDDVATTYPGAPELCNEVDDDCDGEVDEEVVDQTYYLDEDGDGYGYSGEAVEACAPIDGYVDNDLDCHWLDALISPAGAEICDLVDNDCDGEIDEGVAVFCGFGECRRKSELCAILCVPGEPTEEVCNGLDDDCDGEVDEEFCPSGEVCQDGVCVDVAVAEPKAPDEVQMTEGQSAAPTPAATGAEVAEEDDASGSTDVVSTEHNPQTADETDEVPPDDGSDGAPSDAESPAERRNGDEVAPASSSDGSCRVGAASRGLSSAGFLALTGLVVVGRRRRQAHRQHCP